MFRKIQIEACLNGYIVRAGCQTLVFQTADELLRELRAYMDDPVATEQRFLKNAKHCPPVAEVGIRDEREQSRELMEREAEFLRTVRSGPAPIAAGMSAGNSCDPR